MTGLNEFLKLFGGITIADITFFTLAAIFLYAIYKEVKKYINAKVVEQQKQSEDEKKWKQKIDEAWNAVQEYPKYRQHSLDVQKILKEEVQEIRDGLQVMMKRFEEIEEQNKKRECSKLRNMLMQHYRHYTNKQENPSQSWTRMEAETFWALFKEYEEAGGNGYMHTVVQPEMEQLLIVEHNK